MVDVEQTETYARWFSKLSDKKAQARINARIRRLTIGNPGDVKTIGAGVSELRIDYGPGYRIYFLQQGRELVILLAGGDKATQERDIKNAVKMAETLQENRK